MGLFSVVKEAVNRTVLSELYLFQVKTDCGCWSEAEHIFPNVLNSSVLCAIFGTIQAGWVGLFKAKSEHVEQWS